MIPNSSDKPAGAVPQVIARTLKRLIRRIREVVLLRGISAVVATAVGALLAIMAIDASVVLFSDVLRWLLTLSALALTVASAVWFLILPLAKTITLTGIARSVEDRHPELQERLSSAVELLTSRDMPEIRGSEALIGALAEEATRDAAHMRPRTEIPLKAARPFLLAAGGTMLIIALLLGLYPNAQRLLVRAVAPYLNLPNVSADMLRVTPGDARILEGQRLEVEVAVANTAVSKAQFRKLLPDGSEAAEAMTALPPTEAGEPRFTLTCPPGAESFRYRIHAGDALSKYFTVTVVPPPVVKRLEVRYEYPEYTKREPRTDPDSAGEIKAVAGTVVTVSAVTNKPVKAAQLQIGGQTPKGSRVEIAAAAEGANVCKFQVKLTPRLKSRWTLQLTDEFGFTNSSGDRLIEATPDLPPVVKLLGPENKKLRLKPTDHLPLAYTMTDDFGIAGAAFAIETDSRKHQAVAVLLPPETDKPLRAAAGETMLELAKLPLQGARQFTLHLRANDNLPGNLKGPQEGRSETVTVELDITAATYAMQALESEIEVIRKALEKILKELKESKKDSVPLKNEPAKLQALAEETTKRLERMRGHLGIAKDTVAEVTPKVLEGTFEGLAPKMAALTTEVDGAHDKSGQIKLVETLNERSGLATQTATHIDRAIQIVEEMLKLLKEMADIARLAQSLQDLAERQEDLAAAKAEAEMAAQEANAQDWQKSESQVSSDVGNLVKDMAAAKQAQLQQDQARAKDLAAEARKLQKEQQALREDTNRLGQLSQIDQALKDLAAQQAALARDTAQTKAAADQSKPMADAAENIKGGALAQAVEKQKAAEDSLKKRAETGVQPPAAKEDAGQQQAGKPMSPEEKSQAGQLAARQQDLRQRTEALLAQRKQAAGEIAQSQMGRLKQEQTEVAKEAAQIAQAAAPLGQEPAQSSQEAAGNAKEAADAIPANIADAAQHATAAGKELGSLAQDLNKQVARQAAAHNAPEKAAGQQEAGAEKPAGQEAGGQEAGGQPSGGQPSSGSPSQGQTAQLAQQASTLAERQQELAREMQALAADQTKQALQAEQQAIQAQTADLQKDAAALGERAQAMAPQSNGNVQQAKQALAQARQAESQASQAMAGQSPQSAVGSQQWAANELGNAAQALSAVGQALAQAASQAPPASSPMGPPMADAFSSASQAAQSQSAASAAQASQAMSAAASQAMGMAQGMGVKPGQAGQQPGMPSQGANSKKGVGAVGINSTAAKLESLGIKLSDWARLPGELRNQILQAAEEASPEEYRTLIKRYFQQVAKRGGESEGATP